MWDLIDGGSLTEAVLWRASVILAVEVIHYLAGLLAFSSSPDSLIWYQSPQYHSHQKHYRALRRHRMLSGQFEGREIETTRL